MRTLAAALRGDASMIAVVSSDAAATVDSLEFYGPAADRIDAGVTASARNGGSVAERLISLAALLDRAAADVEAKQRERARELERLRRELAPRMTR